LKLSEIEEEYRKSMAESQLPYLNCMNCGLSFYYQRGHCPRCGSGDIKVLRSSGIGSVFSFTVIRRKDRQPTVYAIIEMQEGFRLYSNIVDGAGVRVGEKVSVIFKEMNGESYPFFIVDKSGFSLQHII